MELKSTLARTGGPTAWVAGFVVPSQPVGAVDECSFHNVESRNGASIVVAAYDGPACALVLPLLKFDSRRDRLPSRLIVSIPRTSKLRPATEPVDSQLHALAQGEGRPSASAIGSDESWSLVPDGYLPRMPF